MTESIASGAPAARTAKTGIADARLDSLDTLRGVAILMVVLFHVSVPFKPSDWAQGLLGFGNSGVQLFFLVSAVTMCHMWSQRPEEPDRRTRFYIRRVFRIAPLFWFAMVLYTLLYGVAPHAAAYAGIGPTQIVATALFLHGFLPDAINAVVPGGWSIAVEMSFYVVFPWLAMLRPERLLPAAFLAYVVLGLACTQWILRVDGGEHMAMFLYYSLLTQFPVFLVGMLVYWIGVRRVRLRLGPVAGIAAAWIALALAGKYALGLPGRPFFWIQVAAFALVMVPVLRRGWSVPALGFVGRISYSMYLFHFAVIDAIVYINPELTFTVAVVLALAGTIAIGLVSQRTAERWSQDAGRVLIRALASR